jgi:hypothetical protein
MTPEQIMFICMMNKGRWVNARGQPFDWPDEQAYLDYPHSLYLPDEEGDWAIDPAAHTTSTLLIHTTEEFLTQLRELLPTGVTHHEDPQGDQGDR